MTAPGLPAPSSAPAGPGAAPVASRAPVVAEAAALALMPAVLVLCAATRLQASAVVSFAAALVALGLFFAAYEGRRPNLRQTMPVVVMAALGAAGRILFAPLPDVKPTSAIAIVAGAVFGRHAGFMTGALAALLSNFFFGQGPWTPWQMYAWGMVGWLAGVLGPTRAWQRPGVVYACGFASGLLYGLIVNLWSIVGFYHPQTAAEFAAVYAAALPFDVVHGAATAAFLALLWNPWRRKLGRLLVRYGLAPGRGPAGSASAGNASGDDRAAA